MHDACAHPMKHGTQHVIFSSAHPVSTCAALLTVLLARPSLWQKAGMYDINYQTGRAVDAHSCHAYAVCVIVVMLKVRHVL